MTEILSYPIAFLVLLGVIVTFHEFGHYLVARFSGVQILKFSVGFGRPLWRRVDRRGTEFALAVIPLGGYVRMLDDRDPDQAAQKREDTVAYMDLHPKWRIAIALGGPVANLILSVFVFAILAVAGKYVPAPMVNVPMGESAIARAGLVAPAEFTSVDGASVSSWQDIVFALTRRLGESGNVQFGYRDLASGESRHVQVAISSWLENAVEPDVLQALGIEPRRLSVIGQIVPDSPAEAAGLKVGDWVVKAGDEAVSTWDELVAAVAVSNGAMRVEYFRQGVRQHTVAYPRQIDREGQSIGYLGVGAAQHFVNKSIWAALPEGVSETIEKTGLTLMIVKKMIIGDVSVKNLNGPLSIAQVAGESVQYGWQQFFAILAFLSISLGVLNLLPIPILDGGHVVLSGVEWIRGEPVPERVQMLGIQIGVMFIGGLFILTTYNDVLRLF